MRGIKMTEDYNLIKTNVLIACHYQKRREGNSELVNVLIYIIETLLLLKIKKPLSNKRLLN